MTLRLGLSLVIDETKSQETCVLLQWRGSLQEAKANLQLGDVDLGATLAKAQLLETMAQ